MAFATDLLFGFSPHKKNYDKSKLRSHLLMRLEQGKLVLFPQSTESRKKSKQSLTLIDVYCKYVELLESNTDKDLGYRIMGKKSA